MYAHSGRAKRIYRTELFAHDLNSFLASRVNKQFILCGDLIQCWKILMLPTIPSKRKVKELKSLVSSNKLVDNYRYFYSASRLDYIFVPESDKSKILDLNIVPVPSTDHVAVLGNYCLTKIQLSTRQYII